MMFSHSTAAPPHRRRAAEGGAAARAAPGGQHAGRGLHRVRRAAGETLHRPGPQDCLPGR